MPDAAAATALPPMLQTGLAIGLAVGGVLTPILGLWARPKSSSETDPSRAVNTAVIAPLGDPNQLRQIAEELHKLNDFAFQIAGTADDVKDGIRDLKDGQRDLRDAINRPR